MTSGLTEVDQCYLFTHRHALPPLLSPAECGHVQLRGTKGHKNGVEGVPHCSGHYGRVK